MSQRRHKVVPLVTLAALVAVLPHCRSEVTLDAAPPAPVADSSTGPTFIAADSGDADAADAGNPAEQCATTDCPSPYATCSGLPKYKCAVNLATDSLNCGACGNACPDRLPSSLRVEMSCVDGRCQSHCSPAQYMDCNGVPDDGCETDPKTDPQNCGACGVQCAPGVSCIERRCGCPPGQSECNGKCVDLNADDDNCGSCGYDCAAHPIDASVLPPHMVNGCKAGSCGPKCDATRYAFWADCNGNQADGCEINLRGDNNNCVTCGRKCAAGQQCYVPPLGTSATDDADCYDPPGTCPAGQTMCFGTCVDLNTSLGNCGSCGFYCADPPAAVPGSTTMACENARCTSTCHKGFGDCNGRADDGCETDLMKDPRSCGACGASCDNGIGQPCVAGACATKDCDAGGVVK